MKLASTTDVLTRVSVNPELSGAVTSADSALEAATVLLSNMLESEMDRVEVRDYYSPTSSQVGGSLTLYLSHMFVSEDDVVEISYGTYSGDIDADTYTVIDPMYYSIDYTHGLITIDSIPMSGRMSLQVYYSSGFSSESDSTIPSWLNQAAITAAVYVMHTQVAAHGKQDILDISPEYRRMTYAMVQQYMRSRMNCVFATATFTDS